MKLNRLTHLLVVLVCCTMICACGPSFSNSPSTSSNTLVNTTQMGGARQGSPLNLAATVSTMAGTAQKSGSADGTGTAARFNYPSSITTDGTNLYIADTMNNTIRQVVIATGAVTTLAGTAGSTGSRDGTGTAALFYNPFDITTDGTNLYVADTNNNTIRKIIISTGAVTTLAGTAGVSGHTDGTGTAALFNSPFWHHDRRNESLRSGCQ